MLGESNENYTNLNLLLLLFFFTKKYFSPIPAPEIYILKYGWGG